MGKRDTTNLPLEELTFYEIKQEHLMEHARSLGGKKATEAARYLIELNKRIPLTEKEKEAMRQEMKSKTKRIRVEVKDDDGNVEIINGKIQYTYIETGKKMYSDNRIEQILKEHNGVQQYSNMKQKQLYCEKYWTEKTPSKKEKQEMSYDEQLAALLAELEAGA